MSSSVMKLRTAEIEVEKKRGHVKRRRGLTFDRDEGDSCLDSLGENRSKMMMKMKMKMNMNMKRKKNEKNKKKNKNKAMEAMLVSREENEEQKVVEDEQLKTVIGVRVAVDGRQRKVRRTRLGMDATRNVGCYTKMEYDFLEHATVVMSSHFAPLVQFVAPQEREHCQQLAVHRHR